MALIDPKYVATEQLQLELTEKSFSIKGDDSFVVADGTGRRWFTIDAKLLSLGEDKVMKDATGAQVLVIHKKRIAIGERWVIKKTSGEDVATCKKAKLAIKPTVKVVLAGSSRDLDGDGVDDGDYKCVGSLLKGAKRFTVFNGAGAEVGEIKKQGRFSSLEGFVRAKVTDADKYIITVKPGTDAAFMVSLGFAVDELFHDEPEAAAGSDGSSSSDGAGSD